MSEGRGHDKSNCLENALAGFGRSLLLPFLPPLTRGQTQALERKRLSHKTANPAQFSTVCASSCQPVVLLLDLPCWTCSGCLILPNTAKGAAFHTVLSWDCPRTHPGVTPDYQVLSHCLQFSLTLPRCFLRFWQDLQDSPWSEQLRAGTGRDLPEFRDPVTRDIHNGFGRLKIDLAPYSWACNTYGCFNRCLFLTS